MSDTNSCGTFERHLQLQGAVNFRDLGGYQTHDGRQVKWGRVYRSDQLAELSDDDSERISQLGMRTVCDLRAEFEREAKPNRLASAPVPMVYEFGFVPHRAKELMEASAAGTIAVKDISPIVTEVYRRFATEQAQAYANLLALLSRAELPMLIHCTSGRDRTGFAAAVILTALGVPKNIVFEDYLLSNRYRRDLTFQLGSGVNEAVMTELTNAKPEYLQAAFTAIDEQWGSFDDYLEQKLGVTRAGRQKLQARLLAES